MASITPINIGKRYSSRSTLDLDVSRTHLFEPGELGKRLTT